MRVNGRPRSGTKLFPPPLTTLSSKSVIVGWTTVALSPTRHAKTIYPSSCPDSLDSNAEADSDWGSTIPTVATELPLASLPACLRCGGCPPPCLAPACLVPGFAPTDWSASLSGQDLPMERAIRPSAPSTGRPRRPSLLAHLPAPLQAGLLAVGLCVMAGLPSARAQTTPITSWYTTPVAGQVSGPAHTVEMQTRVVVARLLD